MKRKLINEISETVSEIDQFDLLNIEGIKNYIAFRDQKINDKIYPEENELILIKAKHDEKAKIKIKGTNSLMKEILFNVGQCDITAAKAVAKALNEFKSERIKYESIIKEQNLKLENQNKQLEIQSKEMSELKQLLQANKVI